MILEEVQSVSATSELSAILDKVVAIQDDLPVDSGQVPVTNNNKVNDLIRIQEGLPVLRKVVENVVVRSFYVDCCSACFNPCRQTRQENELAKVNTSTGSNHLSTHGIGPNIYLQMSHD